MLFVNILWWKYLHFFVFFQEGEIVSLDNVVAAEAARSLQSSPETVDSMEVNFDDEDYSTFSDETEDYSTLNDKSVILVWVIRISVRINVYMYRNGRLWRRGLFYLKW